MPSPPHSLNAAARCLVRSRDRQEDPDRQPCSESRRQELCWHSGAQSIFDSTSIFGDAPLNVSDFSREEVGLFRLEVTLVP